MGDAVWRERLHDALDIPGLELPVDAVDEVDGAGLIGGIDPARQFDAWKGGHGRTPCCRSGGVANWRRCGSDLHVAWRGLLCVEFNEGVHAGRFLSGQPGKIVGQPVVAALMVQLRHHREMPDDM